MADSVQAPKQSIEMALWLQANGYGTADNEGNPTENFSVTDDVGVLWKDPEDDPSIGAYFLGAFAWENSSGWDFFVESEGVDNREEVEELVSKLRGLGVPVNPIWD